MNTRDIINKNTILTSLVLMAICFWGGINANTQQFDVQGDLISSYIWRGIYQTGVNIQPTLGSGAGGFSLTAWGSADFDGTPVSAGAAAKEIDLTAAYTLGNSGLTFPVADLWRAGQEARKYFNFKSHETAHHFGAGPTYAVQPERSLLPIAWYTMFVGQSKNAEGKQNYSSYVEFNYPSCVKIIDLNATCGIVPYATPQYNCDGLAVTNVASKGTTRVRFNDTFALPIFTQVVWNPRMEGAYLVFGITLKP